MASGARVRGITIEFGGDASGLNAALKQVNSSARSCQAQLRDVNRAMRLDPTNIQMAQQKYNALQQSISATKEKLETLKNAEKQLQSEMKNGGTAEQQKQLAALQREIVATEAQMKRLENTWGSGSARMLQIGNVMTSLGSKFSAIGDKLKVVSVAVTAFGAASVKAFTDVDAGAKKAIYATGAVGTNADAIRTAYQNVAKGVAGTFEEIGATVGEVSTRFGLTGTELEKLSTRFQQFATITGQDGQAAVQGIDLALRTFNLSGSEAENVMGLLAKTSQNTGMSVQTLESLLQQSGAVLKEMGLGLTESVNLMATFEKAGIDSSTMLTSMKKAATYFSDSGKDMNTGLRDLTARLQDAGTSAQATSEAYDIFGKRAGLAFVTAAKEGKISLDGLSDDLSKYSSVVEDTYNETRTGADKMAGAWKKVKLALSGFGEAIGDVVGPWMSNLALALGDLTQGFNQLSPSAKSTTVGIGLFVAALGPAVLIVGKVITSVGRLVKTVSSLSILSKIPALLNPIGIAIMSIVAAIGAVALINEACKNSFNWVSESSKRTQESISNEIQSWDQLQKTRQNTINSSTAAAAANTSLLNILTQMVDANGRVNDSEQSRAQAIISQLNSALGTQITLQNGIISVNGQEITSNNQLQDSIQQVINLRQAEAMIDANQEAYNNALKNQVKNTRDYYVALEDVNKTKERIAELERGSAWDQQVNGYGYLVEKLKEQEASLEDANRLRQEGNAIIKQQEDLIAGTNGNSQLLAETTERIRNSITAWDGANIEQVSIAAEDAVRGLNDVTKAATSGTEEVSQTTLNSLANALALQILEVQKAGGDVAGVIAGMSEQSKTALEQANLSGALSEEARAGFAAYKNIATSETAEATQNVAQNGAEMAEAGGAAGTATGANLAEGMRGQEGNIQSAGAADALAAKFGLQTYDGESKTWGQHFIDGFVAGIKGAIGSVRSAAESVANALKERLGFTRPEKGPLHYYEQWMPHFMQGMAKTLKSSKKVLLNEVNSVAKSVNSAMTFDSVYTPVLKPVLDTSMMTTATIKDNSTTSVTFTEGIKKAFTEALQQSDALKPQVNQTINGLQVNDEVLVNNLIDVANNKNARREAM